MITTKNKPEEEQRINFNWTKKERAIKQIEEEQKEKQSIKEIKEYFKELNINYYD